MASESLYEVDLRVAGSYDVARETLVNLNTDPKYMLKLLERALKDRSREIGVPIVFKTEVLLDGGIRISWRPVDS